MTTTLDLITFNRPVADGWRYSLHGYRARPEGGKWTVERMTDGAWVPFRTVASYAAARAVNA